MTNAEKIVIGSLMNLFEQAKTWIKRQCAGQRFDNPNQLADFLKLSASQKTNFYRALDGKSVPLASTFFRWLEVLGVRLLFPGEEATTMRPKHPANGLDELSAKTIRDAVRRVLEEQLHGKVSVSGRITTESGRIELDLVVSPYKEDGYSDRVEESNYSVVQESPSDFKRK